MFTRSTRHIRPIIAALLVIGGLSAAPYAQARATDACIDFLNAQDYARAESEAQALLKRQNLSREEQRYTWLCLGRAQDKQGRKQDALPAFQQVERLSQTTKELSTSYNHIGSIFYALNDLDRAELYFQRQLKADRELGDKSGEAFALNNLALVAGKRGDYERKLALLQEALAVEPDESQKSSQLNNIAMFYSNRGDHEQAESMMRQHWILIGATVMVITRQYVNSTWVMFCTPPESSMKQKKNSLPGSAPSA